MYFVSILAIIIVVLAMAFSMPLIYLLDFPSLILLLVFCIPILFSAGLQKDFCRAFHIALSKKTDVSLTSIKRSSEAVSLVIKTLLCGGLFMALLQCIIVLHLMVDLTSLGPNINTSCICLIYALAFSILLLPLKSILKVRMAEYMQE